jgi:hypothetical protein
MATKTITRRTTQPTTDRQRFDAVFSGLVAHGVAYWFDLRGATGVREDRYHDYVRNAERCGTDRWVGEHVGNVDCGGGFWGDDGRLYGGRKDGRHVPYGELWWSFNHEVPGLAELLVGLFTEQGFDAWWSGDTYDCVIVRLDGAR